MKPPPAHDLLLRRLAARWPRIDKSAGDATRRRSLLTGRLAVSVKPASRFAREQRVRALTEHLRD